MHTCPDCGAHCYCGGDIDDAHVTTDEWAFYHCEHDCREDDDEADYWKDEDDFDRPATGEIP